MKQLIVSHFSRIAAVLTLCALCALTLAAGKNEKTASPIDLNAYASLMSNRITRVEDLINRHYDQQDTFALLIPPGLELLNQPGNPDTLVIDFSSKELNPNLVQALLNIPPVYRNSVPTYEIALQETVQGAIEIRDNADQLLYTDPAPIGYVIPYELLFRQSQNPMLYYPELARYRLKTKLTLLPEQYVEHYLYAQARIAEGAALIQEEEGGGMMLMREGMEEEVYISGMREETNGLLLELSYPESYSGSVWSAYSYDARDTPSKTFMGLENVWTLISSNIVLTGETSVAWIDTRPMGFDEQTNPVHRFYAFGANTDSDNDGLNDGYELFVTKTNPNNPDSDGDGVNDADELTLGLDPNNPDDLPNVKGTIIYDGRQTNDIYVLAVQDDPYGWELDYAAALNAPGVYHLIALPPGTYYIKAWRDLNGNGRLDSEEAFGAYSNNPVIVTGQVTGVDFQLTEPDSDEDGVSDYIERAVFRANPYDSADIPPQLERQSGPCYYGHGTGSSVWQYAESNLGMLKFYPVGHGWVTNGVFIPDLSSPSELIYFGEAKGFPGYDSGGWVYSRSIALDNYVDMGSGWIWADRFLTDHTVPSRIVRYLRPSPSGKPDLFVFSHSFNTEGDDVGFGWVRHGSFTADFSKPFSTIYQGLVQAHWTSTNMALRHTLPASRTWLYNKGTLGYGWATAAGFVPKSGLFNSYYYGVLKNSGGVVGYSTTPANFDDLGATISLGYGYLAGGDFLPLPGPSDPPISEYDQDGDGFLDIPMDSPDQFAVIDDSEFLQLPVSIGDSSGSHTEMYGYRIGDFSYDMPYVNSSQYMFDSVVPLQRGKSYTGSFRSLSDDDDDGDYTFFVGESPSPGFVIVANFVFGAVEGSGFNSGSKPFTVHVPRVNIHAYQPGLLGSPGLEVTRFHEQRPYAVILPAYELAPPEVLSTNDGAVSRLRIEQFKPSALSNGTLRITISDTNVLALYDHNNKRASTLAYNLSTIVATNPLYYLKSADRVWHVLGLNPGAASVTLSYSDTNDMLICSDIIEFSVHDLAIVPDWNRDRSIDALDINQANAANPFRFWLNDDADTGDISEGDSDVSGRSGGLLGKANYKNNKVDGRSDLEDFFPVWLNLGRTLAAFPPSGVVQYRLSQADRAVKAVYTDLRRNNAGGYLISEGDSYGSLFSKHAHEANTFTIPPGGIPLSPEFLNRVASDGEKGVLLMEGAKATTEPLVLEVFEQGISRFRAELPLSIDGVEKMYRWINLRHVTGGVETRVADTSEPGNYPDAESNGKQFVFVHGFNSSEEGARGWNAEVFKRLYQSGSRAMFTAVTWEGDETPGILPPGAYYHADVINAFQAASALASQVAALPGEKYVAAHSLGNMVASSAIVDYGLDPERYFMINAAVAMEAYDSEHQFPNEIAESPWTTYTNRVWASDWYRLFDSSDGRYYLSWRDRFANISQAVNYYSSGEDVLNNNNPPENMYMPMTERAWVFQEKVKGGILPTILIGVDSHGGWGINGEYSTGVYDPSNDVFVVATTPEQAAAIPPYMLRTHSFFKEFYNDDIYGASGSTLATDVNVRTKVLAEAIPSTSRAAGRNELSGFGLNGGLDGNEDLMSMKTGWPRANDNWLHSDFKKVAYAYVRQFFEDMVAKGEL